MGTAIKLPVPDQVKPSLSHERQSAQMSKRMLYYSCTHMATVGVKGLNSVTLQVSVHAEYTEC